MTQYAQAGGNKPLIGGSIMADQTMLSARGPHRRVMVGMISGGPIADIIDDVSHCPAYYQLLVKSLTLPGLLEIAEGKVPTHLVICGKDRVLPHPRFTRHFTTQLPKDTKITHLDHVGHIPMFEAPDRIAQLIVEFADRNAAPPPREALGG